MRGQSKREPGFISLINVENLIAADHPLRRIKVLVDEARRRLEPELAAVGAPESRVAVEQARLLQQRGFRPKTIRADRGYHTSGFIDGMRAHGITPQPALMRNHRRLGVVVNAAHRTSQKIRKRIEEIFGWSKTVGGLRQTRYRGVARTHAANQYVVASLNKCDGHRPPLHFEVDGHRFPVPFASRAFSF